MSFAFELHFDPATEATIRAVWDALAQAGCDTSRNGFAPHVTLAIAAKFEESNVDALCRFAREHLPFPVEFDSVGSFPSGVIFYRPRYSDTLHAIHRAFHDRFDALPAAANSHWYRPEEWQPHCTVAMGPPSYGANVIVTSRPLPPAGTFQRLRVVEYPALKMRCDCALGPA